jgi:hypothetical protein
MAIPPAPLVMDRARGPVSCHLRFVRDMVSEFSFLLPRGVTVAQVTLDHFVMVRIHARQCLIINDLQRKRPNNLANLIRSLIRFLS